MNGGQRETCADETLPRTLSFDDVEIGLLVQTDFDLGGNIGGLVVFFDGGETQIHQLGVQIIVQMVGADFDWR